MATLVLTAIGDDQSGLVDALSEVVADHGGNWDTSHMARLGGKFAGIVMVTLPDRQVDALIGGLKPLEAEGLLDITVGEASATDEAEPATSLSLRLVGLDHPGIIHDIWHALAVRNVSIDELRTETSSAPMGGGTLFEADMLIRVPTGVATADLVDALEELANNLMVDLEVGSATDPQ